MRRRGTVFRSLLLCGLLAACVAPPPAPPPEAEPPAETEAPSPDAAVTDARLALAGALIEARTARITLYHRAMALPSDSPLRPTLADRADRLKRAEAEASAAQQALHTAPTLPSARQAQAMAAWLLEMTDRLAR